MSLSHPTTPSPVSDDRRAFTQRLGLIALGGGAALLAACGGNPGTSTMNPPPVQLTDADVLNFALNLEYLEAEFYTYATTGQGISNAGIQTSGTGTAGLTTGGSQVKFTDPVVAAVAAQIALDEQDHVKLLRQALGSAAVAKPAINLAALGLGFAGDTEFLTLARAFEDTGVSAYAGAAPLIATAATLGTAAQILGTESEHSGNIRLLVVEKAIAVGAIDSRDIVPSSTHYFPVDSNGLALTRTTRQVLDIVYAGSGAKGGFFPAGFNGTIAS